MLYLLIFSGSLMLVIFSAPYLITLLKKFNIVDYPGGRKKHTEPIPRMGGILLFAPLMLFLFMFSKDQTSLSFIVYSSGIIALCGIIDDVWGLKWQIKYLMQSAAAIIILFYLVPGLRDISLFGIYIPEPFNMILLFFFITGVMNAVNMLDGLDGLLSGAGLLLFMLVFMLSYVAGDSLLMIISASFTGSLIAFLKFNAYPARIFLGDTGSLIIGFFLAFSALVLSNRVSPVDLDLGFAVILLGLPVVDTIKVILLRLYNKKSPFHPDRRHIHHKIQDNNIPHKHTVFVIQLITVAYIFLAVYYAYYNRFIAGAFFLYLSSALILFNPLYQYFLRGRRRIAELIPFIYSKRLTVELFKKVLIPLSGLIILLVVLFIFPSESDVPAEVVTMMISVCLLLVFAAVLSFKRYNGFHEIYVLLNLTIFFALSGYGEPYRRILNITNLNTYMILDLSIAVILGFIGFFILFRDKIFGKKVSLFSGLDLIIMIFIVLTIILQNILPLAFNGVLGQNLLTGFIVYIWYKIVIIMIPAVNRRIYVFAFILPVAMLLKIAW